MTYYAWTSLSEELLWRHGISLFLEMDTALAASTAAESGASVLMMSTDSLGSGHGASTDGIAAPIKESTMKSHSDDTRRDGEFPLRPRYSHSRISLAYGDK